MNRKKRGFTLIELLTVMAIMGMLTTIAVTSYFAAIRGMARRSALKHLADTMVSARQRACMEGSPVSVVIFNDRIPTTDPDADEPELIRPTYVVCKQLGRITCLPGDHPRLSGQDMLIDEFTDLDKLYGQVADDGDEVKKYAEDHKYETLRLYNLRNGKWCDVYPKVFSYELEDRTSSSRPHSGDSDDWDYVIPVSGFVVKNISNNNAQWRILDPYGVEVEPANTLPLGFRFDDLSENDEDDAIIVTFSPDGGVSAKRRSIRIKELAGGKRASVTVESNGSVTWTQRGSAWK